MRNDFYFEFNEFQRFCIDLFIYLLICDLDYSNAQDPYCAA